MTLIQQSQEKLERFFTMSKSYSQIEFFLVDWNDMTKGLKIECIEAGFTIKLNIFERVNNRKTLEIFGYENGLF